MKGQTLEEQARGMDKAALQQALDWNKALAEHADENMQFREYGLAKAKVDVLEAELRRRP